MQMAIPARWVPYNPCTQRCEATGTLLLTATLYLANQTVTARITTKPYPDAEYHLLHKAALSAQTQARGKAPWHRPGPKA